MTPRKVQNPLALAVLACLWERPMHPYEMATTLKERHKHESIKLNYGSLYTVVDALVGARLIEARETVRESRRPERTVYELTAAGAAELETWLADLLGTPVKEFTRFEAALSLMAALPPDRVAGLLEERMRRLEAEEARLAAAIEGAASEGVPRLFLIEAEYALSMREAERAWVGKLVRLVRGSPSFTKLWKEAHATRAKRRGRGPQRR